MVMVRFFEFFAKRGSARAMMALGIIYLEGDVVSEDREKAKKWFINALDAGWQPARLELEKLNRVQ